MNNQDFLNLQEAYFGVYDELDEEVPGKIELYPGSPRVMKNAGPARVHNPNNPKKVKRVKEQVDIYDIILSHLLDEGYAETLQGAEAIMANMSEEWRQSICEEMVDEANRAEQELGLSSRERERARNLQTNLSKPIFYGKRNSQLGNTSDSGMNKMHRRLRNRRRKEHEARRGEG